MSSLLSNIDVLYLLETLLFWLLFLSTKGKPEI
jgi:hypothetical protein